MKLPIIKQFFVGIFLAGTLVQAAQVFAQTKQEKEEGTIKIRIEKQKDGKTEIIEKTYKADEWPGDIPEAMFFNFSDSFKDFGDNFHMQFDTAFSGFNMPHIPEMSFQLNGRDSLLFRNELFLQKGMDSLLKKHEQMVFQFNHTMKPSLDSMLDKLSDSKYQFNFRFDNDFNIDSMLNKRIEGMKNFRFNWPDDFDGNGLNLMLDKELYNVEETEDENGNKMIRITPKTDKRVEKNAPGKNSGIRMQPSPSQLNLSYNPINKHLMVGFTLPGQENVVVSVINPEGKEVYKKRLKNFTGSYQKEIRVKGSGVFTVKVVQDKSIMQEKIKIK